MQPTIEEIKVIYSKAIPGDRTPDLSAWVQVEEDKEASQTLTALSIDPDKLQETEEDLKTWIDTKERNLGAIVLVNHTYAAKGGDRGAMLTCFGGDALLLYRLFRQQLWMLNRSSINPAIPTIAEITVNRFLALEMARVLPEYGIEMLIIE